MKSSITEKERKVLSFLKQYPRPVLPAVLAEKLQMHNATVRSLLESLVQKQHIEYVEKTITKFLTLTKEARYYAKVGLPEIRLAHILKDRKGTLSLMKLEKEPSLDKQELRHGLAWARRKGWVIITKETEDTWLKLTKLGLTAASEDPVQHLLESSLEDAKLTQDKLGDTPTIQKKVRKELLDRTLAVVVEETSFSVLITDAGSLALEQALSTQEMISNLTPDLLKSGDWQNRPFRPYNLQGPVPRIYPGKKHPYIEFIDHVKRILIGLGFQEAKGPLVELEFWNCDALFMPQDHVAREVHDMYHIKSPKTLGEITNTTELKHVAATHEDGWVTDSTGWRYKYSFEIARRLVLRSQTTAVSVRYLVKHQKAPLRMFSIDRVFRPEKFDSTHSAEFLQCEGIIGGDGLTLRDLIGYLSAIAQAVGIKKIKFKPGFFPFTEPSIEGFIYTSELGWVEALPGGIFRPEVTRPLGIDFPVLAWGIGIDRLAMAALGIQDIRELATRDLRRLRTISLRF
jgi:phenylalanyl-tRNA synthetase alpha chain